MQTNSADPKKLAVLEAAYETFATYGFRKTSMDDIARKAGMSRPALYLHYKNKEDIFRSLVVAHYEKAALDVKQALVEQGSISDILTRAFLAQTEDMARAMLSSPHAEELQDTGMTVIGDIVCEGEDALAKLYADWLRQQETAGVLSLKGPAEEIAATITAALKGLKMTAPDYDTYETRLRHLAMMLGTGLST